MNKKVIPLLLSLCLVGGFFTGCQKDEKKEESVIENSSVTSITESSVDGTEPQADTGTHIVIDHYGYEVIVPNQIERVAIVWLLPLPSVLAVYQGGNVDNLVAMPPDALNAAENSILAKYCPEILNVSTDFYHAGELNMEELLNLKPDIIFYTGPQRAEIFQNAGVPAVGFATTIDHNPSPINSVGKWLELMEDVFQKESKTQGIMQYAEETEAEISRRVQDIPVSERKKVLIIGHYTDVAITPGGKGSFSQYWCEAVGAECVALDSEQAEVNMEQIYEWAPDVILLSTLAQFYPENLYNNTAGTGHDWSTVPAVQNQEVYKFPLGTHRWWPPSSDAPLSLWWVAKTVYPEQFADISIEEKVKDYYKEFYNMDLTEEDINQILHPSEDLGRKFY